MENKNRTNRIWSGPNMGRTERLIGLTMGFAISGAADRSKIV